jgi:hypothetical protein
VPIGGFLNSVRKSNTQRVDFGFVSKGTFCFPKEHFDTFEQLQVDLKFYPVPFFNTYLFSLINKNKNRPLDFYFPLLNLKTRQIPFPGDYDL